MVDYLKLANVKKKIWSKLEKCCSCESKEWFAIIGCIWNSPNKPQVSDNVTYIDGSQIHLVGPSS
jgi:hypothetical protein